jgi:hypothetical protein
MWIAVMSLLARRSFGPLERHDVVIGYLRNAADADFEIHGIVAE